MLIDARTGARDVGRLLESKQLRANKQKSRFVVIGSPKSKTEILKDAEANPIMMATGEPLIYVSDKKNPSWTLPKITRAPQYVGLPGSGKLTHLPSKRGPLLFAQTCPRVKKPRDQSFSKPKKSLKFKGLSNVPLLFTNGKKPTKVNRSKLMLVDSVFEN